VCVVLTHTLCARSFVLCALFRCVCCVNEFLFYVLFRCCVVAFAFVAVVCVRRVYAFPWCLFFFSPRVRVCSASRVCVFSVLSCELGAVCVCAFVLFLVCIVVVALVVFACPLCASSFSFCFSRVCVFCWCYVFASFVCEWVCVSLLGGHVFSSSVSFRRSMRVSLFFSLSYLFVSLPIFFCVCVLSFFFWDRPSVCVRWLATFVSLVSCCVAFAFFFSVVLFSSPPIVVFGHVVSS